MPLATTGTGDAAPPVVPRPLPPLKVAISECLLGANVRYDGSHKRPALCHDELTGLFDYVPRCPEVAIGLGVPRPPIRLVGDLAAPRAVGVRADIDATDALRTYAGQLVNELDGQIAGYIFMKGSPSCGSQRVPVYGDNGVLGHGRGLVAEAVITSMPLLPVEDSGRLFDARLRENFVMRVFTFAHWQAQRARGLAAAGLIGFHSRHKYLLMAHSVSAYRAAGRLLAHLKGADIDSIGANYFELLMKGLARPATRRGHANVLSHLQGYLKQHLDSATRQELARLIDAYRLDEVPLVVPITMLQHLLRRFPDEYVLAQTYLDPYPGAKGMRNQI